jgi:hypothetical protein
MAAAAARAASEPRAETVGKIAIVAVEQGWQELSLIAHYNPNKIQIDKTVPWKDHPVGESSFLEYTQGGPRTISMELFFDCYESARSPTDPRANATLESELDTLSRMALPRDPEGPIELRRPPVLRIATKGEGGMLPRIQCVIESLSISITMFDILMRPVRATVTLKLKEVSVSYETTKDGKRVERIRAMQTAR